MKKILLILIFLLAFILRFWQLGANPASLDWDEASLGYNAYSLLQTGKDEYGVSWPISIRSFNDHKPPLYTYLTMIPVAIFGLNEFSTRFISAFFGTLSILVGYFLIKELFPQKSFIPSTSLRASFYLLSFIFIALSPWHIQFSRIAFEANLALFFFTTGILLFLKGNKVGKYYIFSFLSFLLSAYAYHSPRLVIPILILGLVLIFRKAVKNQLPWFLTSIFLFVILFIPILKQYQSATGARFGSVTLVNPDERLGSSIKAIEFDQDKADLLGKLTHNRRIVFAREILAGYLDHFNFDFLFLRGDAPGRHHAVGMGMLYWWDLTFIIVGVLYLLRNLNNNNNKALFWWFLVAPLASSLTTGTPHAVRALLYIPIYQIFAAVGVVKFVQFVKRFAFQVAEWTPGRWIVSRSIIIVAFSFFIFNFFYYLHMYWIHTPIEYASWWQYGYKEVVEEVRKDESSFDKVMVTYAYDQPYIFFLFYNQIDPSWYQKNWGEGEIKRSERKFGKYEFRNIEWGKDSQLPRTLLVGTPKEIPEGALGHIKDINFPDGTVAFRIVGR